MLDGRYFDPLPTPQEIAGWDAASVAECGMSFLALMENASREAMHALVGEVGEVRGKTVLLLAGPGNNGGDAVALARHLDGLGAKVTIALVRPRGRYKGAAGFNARLAARLGLPMIPLAKADLSGANGPDIIVDGLLGTGFTGELRPDLREVVEAVNRLAGQSYIFALDIPSGLSGATGVASPVAVTADATVTFEAAKTGLVAPQAAPYVGRLLVRPIGIPRPVRENHPCRAWRMTPRLADALPALDPLLHKGSAGRAVVVGGSRGLTGAPLLAGLGALRAGAGLVSVACPGAVEIALKAGHPDVMTLPVGAGDHFGPDDARAVRDFVSTAGAVALGPGLGRHPDTGAFLRALLPLPSRLVLDADGLFFLATDPELKEKIGSEVVITPHPGEAARLLGTDIPAVEADRLESARALAATYGCVAVLKGPATVVAAPDGSAAVSPVVAPNLAVGGSGDVLSGLAAALACSPLSPLLAACIAVYWHGLAGARLAALYPRRGNLASEIADMLPRALTE
ncbi:carbohydrate kinase, YjeF related protein [Solidesulfovibrio fructosivorans JJ]]|uniref:Bifunctional NAD(P)H-hydrate repair enzyme n=1 Tax=Solidesulfovibrio fructosivorans JJ] TaxID=596151 RepID=E1JWD4_SOLFR|nr:bifunctional ADP-dependent NAD(P)H-hydrate dehydratase/NAD(P)H-hydrate epimerase [Solidesulfovibrio fructosivorans]EFL51231.1 carbohydrate kinase, YjeF related protein [Solidesulfovibrio fructosivorans JJ]]